MSNLTVRPLTFEPGGPRISTRVGSALLDHVSVWAGGRLILNVVDKPDSPAVAFYEATGWRYTHTTTADWSGPRGEAVRLRHYLR